MKNGQRSGNYTANSKVPWVTLQTKHCDNTTKSVIRALLSNKVPLEVLSEEKAKAFVYGPGEKRKATEQTVSQKSSNKGKEEAKAKDDKAAARKQQRMLKQLT